MNPPILTKTFWWASVWCVLVSQQKWRYLCDISFLSSFSYDFFLGSVCFNHFLQQQRGEKLCLRQYFDRLSGTKQYFTQTNLPVSNIPLELVRCTTHSSTSFLPMGTAKVKRWKIFTNIWWTFQESGGGYQFEWGSGGDSRWRWRHFVIRFCWFSSQLPCLPSLVGFTWKHKISDVRFRLFWSGLWKYLSYWYEFIELKNIPIYKLILTFTNRSEWNQRDGNQWGDILVFGRFIQIDSQRKYDNAPVSYRTFGRLCQREEFVCVVWYEVFDVHTWGSLLGSWACARNMAGPFLHYLFENFRCFVIFCLLVWIYF